MKQRVLVFGAAGVGIKAKDLLESQGCDVIAFADNDMNKWGGILEEVPIISPNSIVFEDYDIYAIGMYKHVEKIKKQLMEMGVCEENIIVPIAAPATIFYNSIFNENEENEKLADICICFGGLGSTGLERKLMKFLKHVISYDFKNNFWGFIYYVREVMHLIEDVYSKEFEKSFTVTKYSQLVVDVFSFKAEDKTKIERIIGCDKSHFCLQKRKILFKMVSSKTTFEFWMNRIPRPIDERIRNRFIELNTVLKTYNVPRDEVCVVSGSVLELFGLRESCNFDDLDIIMTSRFRELYGKGLVIVSDMIETHSQNELIDAQNKTVTDDDVIWDEEKHFWFEGIKVACLPLLYYQKRAGGELSESKLIEYYLQQVRAFQEK